MTPDTFAALVNLGAAGAVIIVCSIFINFIKSRDESYERRNAAVIASNEKNVSALLAVIQGLSNQIQQMQYSGEQRAADQSKLLQQMLDANEQHNELMVGAIHEMKQSVASRQNRPQANDRR